MLDRLRLKRPLAFIDLESTGTSPRQDRIVEIAILKLHPDGREEFRCKRVNPRIPIPSSATDVHGIRDEDVAEEPGFAVYAKGVNEFLEGCDFAGYGILHFDLPLLRAEMWRARRIEFSWRDRAVIDAMAIFHQREPRDLAAAVRRYCGREFEHPHSALDDVRATVDVLRGQLEHHEDLPDDLDALHKLCNPDADDCIDLDGRLVWRSGEATFGFGQYKGLTLRQVAAEEPGYLAWLIGEDFDRELKEIAREALRGTFPSRELAD